MSKIKLTDIVIDLETTGTDTSKPYSIAQISAVAFDRYNRKIDLDNSFNVFVAVPNSALYGNSLEWWKGHNREYLEFMLFHHQRVSLKEALLKLTDFIAPHKETLLGVWGYGSTFDNAFISNACQATGVDLPWTYKQDACFRTFKAHIFQELHEINHKAAECFTENLGKNEDHWHWHNALFDATYEAVQLSEMFAALEDMRRLANERV